jgi:DNA-binding transcriptional regulator YhcF (GntR family)
MPVICSGDVAMRPAGEIREALLAAARELLTPDQGPTLQELAERAQVGREAARRTVDNMKRHGHLRVVRTRRVAYRNRPVAEYAPAQVISEASEGFVDLGAAVAGWAR